MRIESQITSPASRRWDPGIRAFDVPNYLPTVDNSIIYGGCALVPLENISRPVRLWDNFLSFSVTLLMNAFPLSFIDGD